MTDFSMNNAEVVHILNSIDGSCSLETCKAIAACEFASQVASDVSVDGKSDAVESARYAACPYGSRVRGVYRRLDQNLEQ